MKMNKIMLRTLVLMLVSGCTVGEKVPVSKKPVLNFQAGINKGGIVDNVDFAKDPSIVADAYSGASNTGFNAGVHMQKPILWNSIETGIDYMYNHQVFTYNDIVNGYSGERKVGTSQFMIPVTYNFGFFKKENPLGKLQIRAGWNFQLNMFSVQNGVGTLPNYATNNFSHGFTIGLTYLPFQFSKGQLGFYIDGYRGSKVYNDFYNRGLFEMPATSYMKFGILFRMK